MASVATFPIFELGLGWAIQTLPVWFQSGGKDRPLEAFNSIGFGVGFIVWATGVVSTSKRSLGVQSSAVQRATKVSSFTWLGCLVRSADIEAAERWSPARSSKRRRSCAPVHTSRWAAAIRSFHLISMSFSRQVIKCPRQRSAVCVLNEGCRGRHVTHSGPDMPMTEHLLDCNEVNAPLIVASGAGVSQSVRAEIS